MGNSSEAASADPALNSAGVECPMLPPSWIASVEQPRDRGLISSSFLGEWTYLLGLAVGGGGISKQTNDGGEES